MHNYTVYRDSRVNTKIEDDLGVIRERLLMEYKGIVALMLVGGFGRGEGSILIENYGIKAVNDYDIVMITEKPMHLGRIDKVKRELAKEVGITWIDIYAHDIGKLKRLKKTIFNYDLKYASYVFWGDPNIPFLIPDMDPSKMPLVEGEKLFITRLWTFLGPFSVEFLDRQLSNNEAFFLANQMSKALLACIDVLLLSKGAYHPSYIERNKRVKTLYPNNEYRYKMFDWAVDFKLRPKSNGYGDLIRLYFRIKDIYLEIMRDFLCLMYKKTFSDWFEYCSLYRKNYRTLLKRAGYLVLRRSLRYEKKLDVDIAQVYLVASYHNGLIDKKYFRAGLQCLSKLTGKYLDDLSWEEARGFAAELRNTI